MSLGNVKRQQFMAREASFSTRGSRGGANLLGWEEAEELKPEQERDCLVAKKKSVADELLKYPKKSEERKRLGMLAHDLDDKIRAIRPKSRAKGIEHYIIDVLKEDMTEFQFNKIMRKAREKMGLPNHPLGKS